MWEGSLGGRVCEIETAWFAVVSGESRDIREEGLLEHEPSTGAQDGLQRRDLLQVVTGRLFRKKCALRVSTTSLQGGIISLNPLELFTINMDK